LTDEKGHGRIEHRELSRISVEATSADFPHARTVLAVRSVRTVVRQNKHSQETRYFISSLEATEQTPQQMGKRIRDHWGAVENRNHWRRDHCFGEDRCRSKNANLAANLGLLRNTLLLIVNNYGGSTTELIEACANDPKLPLRLISKHLNL